MEIDWAMVDQHSKLAMDDELGSIILQQETA